MNNTAALPAVVHEIVSKTHAQISSFFVIVRGKTTLTPEGAILNPMQRQKLQVKLCILPVLADLVQMLGKKPHSLKKRHIPSRYKTSANFIPYKNYRYHLKKKISIYNLWPISIPLSFREHTSQLYLRNQI